MKNLSFSAAISLLSTAIFACSGRGTTGDNTVAPAPDAAMDSGIAQQETADAAADSNVIAAADATPSDGLTTDSNASNDVMVDASAADAGPIKVLVYTFTDGFRHPSIPNGIVAIQKMGAANGFLVDVKGTVNDPVTGYTGNQPTNADFTYFTSANLSQYAAVVFLNTTTQKPAVSTTSVILDAVGKAALQDYMHKGGGFVGIHAAADAEYFWPWYHNLLGATFLSHAAVETTSNVRVEDPNHPATKVFTNPWSHYDEWYNFQANPRATVHVLANLDETTYPGNPNPMGDHPITWCKVFEGGRSFYTALGHEPNDFVDATTTKHFLGGILWAAGVLPASCSVP